MIVKEFVHLHTHSQYSLLEATCKIKDMTQRAAQDGAPALALTDNGNMFGAIEFYFACKEAGIKPILGMEAYIAPKSHLIKGEDREAASAPNRRIVLLAEDLTGYESLCELSSRGYQDGFYYKPRIDFDLLKKNAKGLLVLSGANQGDILFHYQKFGPEAALQLIRDYQQCFGDKFYLELNKTGPEWADFNRFLKEASRITGAQTVAANNVHYMDQSDQVAQEVLICIASNKTLHDETRFRLGSDQYYFKTASQMRALFSEEQDACDRTIEIASRVNLKFNLKDGNGKAIYHLPQFGSENGTPQDTILELSKQGLEVRFQEAELRGEGVPLSERENYFRRLEYELDVIEKMGFTSYFLIVQDFINWAKNNAIPVGPGRGSGAGSLCAYALRITDLDPVQHGLIFERFLNPERISMPDFDIDFCQDQRPRVIEYVTKKYGSSNVSQIITFGRLQARAAIRDVGRVLGMSYSDVDVISKLMPDKLGLTLAEALELEPRLKELMELDPQIHTLMDLAQKIEGLVRHAGIHAAGVIIASKALVQIAPLYRGAGGENVVQYDMKFAEKIGLIKFDFLGLKTLTLIQNAVELIAKNRDKKIVPQLIPLNDPGIYSIMSRGDTAGIFQFEGDGITDAIRKIRPQNFADITAINALYRPGPMDMIPEYTRRMHGETQVEYLFPILESHLKETYGVIIYQEQVMSIASAIASYTLGEADMLRRAMGKKIASEMASQKERFLEGAKTNGYDRKKSAELFDLMAEFANYGFNKSHAAAYCVVAAQTAWLKNLYPVEFYAALLSTEMSDTDNIVKYVRDARKHGIVVRPPHINHSDYLFTVKGDEIFFSLGAIKGVGEAAVQAIVEARNALPNKSFTSLNEFFENVDLRKVNRKTIEALIKAGGLDGFDGAHRAQLMKEYSKFLERAELVRDDRENGQVSLFNLLSDQNRDKVILDSVPSWSKAARLAFEKEVLGFYLSDHPLAGTRSLYKNWTTGEIIDLRKSESGKRVIVAGIVSSLREIISKKGSRMAFSQLEDLTGSVELVVFPEPFLKAEMMLKTDQPLLVAGKLEREAEQCKIIVDRIGVLDEVIKNSKALTIKLNSDMAKDMEGLAGVLKRHPGKVRVDLEIELPELSRTITMDVQEPEGINPTGAFFEELQGLLGHTECLEVRS